MSSVTWMLLPLSIPAFLNTFSRSLKSSNVTSTGLIMKFSMEYILVDCEKELPAPRDLWPGHHPGHLGDGDVTPH